jgi:hypothetical protein
LKASTKVPRRGDAASLGRRTGLFHLEQKA